MALIILASFLCVFAGTFAISLGNARHYLSQQLESHAQDAATSLGLSLSPVLARGDLATLKAMADAIFDRGYYRELVVEAADGRRLLALANPAGVEGVPAWFVALVPLETPPGEALIVDGWAEAGKVRLSSHPGYAYAELWRSGADTLLWLALCAAASLALGLGLVRRVLRPLRSAEAQAEALCDGRYPVQDEIPATRELRQMVLAMNRMSARVRQAFEEQAAAAEALRGQAYLDPVTGLGNRRYFDAQIRHLAEAPEEPTGGALLLLELAGFKGFNDRHGYAEGDALLRRVADLVRSACPEADGCLAARLGGGNFGVIAAHGGREEAEALARRLGEGLVGLRGEAGLEDQSLGHVGAALHAAGEDAGALLGRADMALRMAQGEGACAWRIHGPAQARGVPSGARDWRGHLEEAIRQRRLDLSFQPVLALGAEGALHREVLLRLRVESGEALAAGMFLPMAERVGLASEIDRIAVEAVLERMRRPASQGKSYAVNLAPGSLRDAGFAEWLGARLRAFPAEAQRLIFEVPEYGVLGDLPAARRFAERLRPSGARLAIDHFGRNFASFAYLRSLGAAYLKIDGSFVRGLHLDLDNQFFLRELTRTAHGIDMRVIALGVEAEEEKAALAAIQVDGVQGYLVGRPGEED
jgi:diguanylate cyclase (GGDEF)-like protein